MECTNTLLNSSWLSINAASQDLMHQNHPSKLAFTYLRGQSRHLVGIFANSAWRGHTASSPVCLDFLIDPCNLSLRQSKPSTHSDVFQDVSGKTEKIKRWKSAELTVDSHVGLGKKKGFRRTKLWSTNFQSMGNVVFTKLAFCSFEPRLLGPLFFLPFSIIKSSVFSGSFLKHFPDLFGVHLLSSAGPFGKRFPCSGCRSAMYNVHYPLKNVLKAYFCKTFSFL